MGDSEEKPTLARPGGAELLVERMALAAEAESVRARARQWRNVSDEERGRVGAQLMRMAASGARYSGYKKPPLNYPRIGGGRSAGG
jgi:hypothetical protein